MADLAHGAGLDVAVAGLATDDPPPTEPAWFEAVVTRTIDWASERLNNKQ